MKILIIGGNRFFGRRLVSQLLQENHEVTIINRGNILLPDHEQLTQLKCDRTDRSKLEELVSGKQWDVVYDQVCFDFATAQASCKIFKDKTRHYIFTSTQSVYDYGSNISEETFQPKKYAYDKVVTVEEVINGTGDYGEAKRQAEVAFTKFASFPLTVLRLPMVFGPDDYTGRFKFHVDKIKNREPIFFQNINASLSLIHATDATNLLLEFGLKKIKGIFNACSHQPISLKELMTLIQKFVGGEFILAKNSTKDNTSPMDIQASWTMNTNKLESINPPITEIHNWIKELTLNFAQEKK